eukprot:TRINITY_DN16282_c0_g1_i4.p1 TRINITY_DN16282_c0_g1~~TRINITY_DN16282_c0_g1_i4.p1  ORF type:complete len:304 (+),score=56.56 TRINITY_DN16282_c0_g1_i4:63-914(+)
MGGATRWLQCPARHSVAVRADLAELCRAAAGPGDARRAHRRFAEALCHGIEGQLTAAGVPVARRRTAEWSSYTRLLSLLRAAAQNPDGRPVEVTLSGTVAWLELWGDEHVDSEVVLGASEVVTRPGLSVNLLPAPPLPPPPPRTAVAWLRELPADGAPLLADRLPRSGGLLLRRAPGGQGSVAVWSNQCTHLGIPLNAASPDRSVPVSADRSRMVCSSHGAEFSADDGFCHSGPDGCTGTSLTAVPHRVRPDGCIEIETPAVAHLVAALAAESPAAGHSVSHM